MPQFNVNAVIARIAGRHTGRDAIIAHRFDKNDDLSRYATDYTSNFTTHPFHAPLILALWNQTCVVFRKGGFVVSIAFGLG
jgi:hypothetical protein